jgi:hypothetical protein
MNHAVNPSDTFSGIGSVILSVFAAVVSWQEQAEWAFRISSLFLSICVSAVVLYNHFKKKRAKKS